MCEIIRQAEHVERKYGQNVERNWPIMGIQNIALQLRGSDFLLDYYADPDFAHKLLSISLQSMIASLEYFGSSGADAGLVANQNCSVPLCGPTIYTDHLFRYEQELYDATLRLGRGYLIHHCGVFDQFASIYRSLPEVRDLQIGWESDMRLALDTFPESHVEYFICPVFMKDSSKADVIDKVRTLVDTAGSDIVRVSFLFCDLDNGTPDENIHVAVEALLA